MNFRLLTISSGCQILILFGVLGLSATGMAENSEKTNFVPMAGLVYGVTALVSSIFAFVGSIYRNKKMVSCIQRFEFRNSHLAFGTYGFWLAG